MLAQRFVSQFIQHEPCPKCGSKDNLARYADGHAWCFGCKHHEPPVFRAIPQMTEKVKSFSMPEDSSPQIGVKGWTWLKKYGIMDAETKDFLWSDSREWLIMPVYDADHNLLAWQARTFKEGDRKYMTFGPVSDVLNIIGSNNPIIIVEDLLSAIKVGRQFAAVPLYGSNIPLKTITRLATQFKTMGVWLDMDKSRESLKSQLRASQVFGLGQVRSIFTEKDPKEYSDEEIREKVESFFK